MNTKTRLWGTLKQFCILAVLILFAACSDNSSSSDSTENWLSNPSNYGSSVIDLKEGNDLSGIECKVYNGKTSVTQVIVSRYMLTERIYTLHYTFENEYVNTSSFLEINPSTPSLLINQCNSSDSTFKWYVDQGGTIDCHPTYIKASVTSGPYQGMNVATTMDDVRSKLVEDCHKRRKDFLLPK